MSAHQLAIAKASFSAGLLRPDPSSVPRDEITFFHTSIDRAVNQCSPSNVQQCKAWITRNVFPSSARITALGKYLVALTASFASQPDAAQIERRKPSPKRKRLHLLYLLNDLFHESKYHGGSSSSFASLTSQIQPYLVELLGHTASFEKEKCPKHHRRIEELLELWDSNGYYSHQYIDKLRETARNAARLGPAGFEAVREAEGSLPTAFDRVSSGKDVPFVMPANHGDPMTPYYDLPAGNMMPHIIPNSSTPINPQFMKPLQFVAGPADESLVTVVKDFLTDVNKIFDQEKDISSDTVPDIDELGQPVILDELSGEPLGEAYYGWSRAFCDKMKKRRDGTASRNTREASRDESLGEGPRKRRRYSSSRSPSSEREGRGRLRSYSRSRSHSRDKGSRARYADRDSSRSRTRGRSWSQSRSRSPRNFEKASDYPRSRSRSHSRSPLARPIGSSHPGASYPPTAPPPPPPPPFQAPPPGSSIPPPPFPNQFGPGFPLVPSGLPVPPPPPPPPFHGQGQWPPPPPPLAPHMGFGNQAGPFAPFPGFVPPPPPPPSGPPPQHGPGGYPGMSGSPLHVPPPGQWNAPPYHPEGGPGRGQGRGGGRRDWR